MRWIELRRKTGSTLLEFPLAVTILLLFACMPLIDLMSLAGAGASAYLAAQQAASAASEQQSYADALAGMQAASRRVYGSGLGSVWKISPSGGYQNSGDDLYVLATNYRGGASATYGPNTPMPAPINPSSFLYECSVHTTVQVSPMVNLHALPGLADVPGLGMPAKMTFVANRMVEHPLGLCITSTTGNSQPQAVGSIDIPFDVALNPTAAGSGWNYPNLYNIIVGKGQTPSNEDVLTIQANDPYWTQTQLNVTPKDVVFIDYRADGIWQYGFNRSVGGSMNGVMGCTANGYSITAEDGFPLGAVVGKVGNGAPFYLGAQQYFVPKTSGQFYVAANSGTGPSLGTAQQMSGQGTWTTVGPYSDGSGTMAVRVVVAKQ